MKSRYKWTKLSDRKRRAWVGEKRRFDVAKTDRMAKERLGKVENPTRIHSCGRLLHRLQHRRRPSHTASSHPSLLAPINYSTSAFLLRQFAVGLSFGVQESIKSRKNQEIVTIFMMVRENVVGIRDMADFSGIHRVKQLRSFVVVRYLECHKCRIWRI